MSAVPQERIIDILTLLSDGKPRSLVEIYLTTKMPRVNVHRCIRNYCIRGYVLFHKYIINIHGRNPSFIITEKGLNKLKELTNS